MDRTQSLVRSVVALLVISVICLVAAGGAYMYYSGGLGWLYTSAPDAAVVHAELGGAQMAYDANDFTTALAHADTLLTANQRDVQALLMKASILAQQGSLHFKERDYGQQAIAVAQEVLRIDAENVEAYRIIGYAHEIMQEYPAAHAAYQHALSLDPNNPRLLSQEAHAYDLEGDTDKAIAGYQRALVADPTLFHARLGLARMLAATGDLDGAKAHYLAVAEHSTNARERAEAYYSVASLYRVKKNHADAKALFTQAVAADATYTLARVGLAAEMFDEAFGASATLSGDAAKQRVIESFDMLRGVLKDNPNQSLALFQIGVQLSGLGQYDVAQDVFGQVRTIVPQDITLSANDKQRVLDHVTVYEQALKQTAPRARTSTSVLPDAATQVAGVWCFTDACVTGGPGSYAEDVLNAALSAVDWTHTQSFEFFKQINSMTISLGIGTLGYSDAGYPIALACDNGSPLFQYFSRGAFDPGAFPPPNVPVPPPTTPPTTPPVVPVTCIGHYSCSGKRLIYTDTACRARDVTTCSTQQLCDATAGKCVSQAVTMLGSELDITDDVFAARLGTRRLTLTGHLRVLPLLVVAGGEVRVFWNVTSAASCTVTQSGKTAPIATTLASPEQGLVVSPVTTETTFVLHCDGLAGASPASIEERQTVKIVPTWQEQ